MDPGLLDEDDVPMLVDTQGVAGEELENIESNLNDTLSFVKVPITIVTGMQLFEACLEDRIRCKVLTSNKRLFRSWQDNTTELYPH